MAFGFLDIAVTPSVRAVQESHGVAHMWENFKGNRDFDRFGDAEARFIGNCDSFYMATTSQTGWPYVQHRGGPKGLLKSIDDKTLAFADYRGNFQFISVGNLSANDKVCLFLMDYRRRTRLKIYMHAEVVALEAEPEFTRTVLDGASGKVERIIRLRLRNFDWNCPQHITPRFTEADLQEALQPIHERMAQLEAENAALRAKR